MNTLNGLPFVQPLFANKPCVLKSQWDKTKDYSIAFSEADGINIYTERHG